MIGTKNFWANAILIIAFILSVYFLYTVLKNNNDHLIMGGIAIVVCVTSIVVTFINRVDDKTKKSIEEKATKDELKMVDKKIDDHIVDNRETFKELFQLNQGINEKIDKLDDNMGKKIDKITDFLINESKKRK